MEGGRGGSKGERVGGRLVTLEERGKRGRCRTRLFFFAE